MNILIVDDSRLIRRAISNMAAECGYKPLEASNGAECLVQLEKNKDNIALIMLDWNMPVMDGYKVLVKIRAKKMYNHIPIIMATADGIPKDVVKAIKAGANSYLVKPFTPQVVKERITEVLKKHLVSNTK